jgi:hypothetical protein
MTATFNGCLNFSLNGEKLSILDRKKTEGLMVSCISVQQNAESLLNQILKYVEGPLDKPQEVLNAFERFKKQITELEKPGISLAAKTSLGVSKDLIAHYENRIKPIFDSYERDGKMHSKDDDDDDDLGLGHPDVFAAFNILPPKAK